MATQYVVKLRDSDTCDFSRNRIDWEDVARHIIETNKSHPGAWSRITTSKTNRIALDIARGDKPAALEWIEVETFHRKTGPRIDGQKNGVEIWIRVAQRKTGSQKNEPGGPAENEED